MNQQIMVEANNRYSEYLLKSGRQDVPGQKQVFLDGYITGIKHGFEFGEFFSQVRQKKKMRKGDLHGKKRRK